MRGLSKADMRLFGKLLVVFSLVSFSGCITFPAYISIDSASAPQELPAGPWSPLTFELVAIHWFPVRRASHEYFERSYGADTRLQKMVSEAFSGAAVPAEADEAPSIAGGPPGPGLHLRMFIVYRTPDSRQRCLLMVPCDYEVSYELSAVARAAVRADRGSPLVELDDYVSGEIHGTQSAAPFGRVSATRYLYWLGQAEYPVGSRRYVYSRRFVERSWLLFPAFMLWGGQEVHTRALEDMLAELVGDLARDGRLVPLDE